MVIPLPHHPIHRRSRRRGRRCEHRLQRASLQLVVPRPEDLRLLDRIGHRPLPGKHREDQIIKQQLRATASGCVELVSHFGTGVRPCLRDRLSAPPAEAARRILMVGPLRDRGLSSPIRTFNNRPVRGVRQVPISQPPAR